MTKSYLTLELPGKLIDFITSQPGYTEKIKQMIIQRCEDQGVKA